MSVSQIVTVRRDVRDTAQRAAADFRREATERGMLVVNLISSPGSGKTTLLQATLRAWGDRRRAAVLVGDIATDRDAQRLAPYAPVAQLTTGGACHLELPLVERGLAALAPLDPEFLFIENVGNLVCPASHDLGEHVRISLLSTTEGDDKPAKYPKAFRTSRALVVSKCDLLPYVPFSVERAAADARLIRADLDVLCVSAVSGEGIVAWCEYLDGLRRALLAGELSEVPR